MQTTHSFINTNSNDLHMIPDSSVHLIVTSPPYPMIEMWDEIFIKQNPEIVNDLHTNPIEAFNKMHDILNEVWKECDRVLIDGGFACINIGDATRTINCKFQLFSNHTKIIETFLNLGFSVLPDIHWRKATNSPNKFMGSGMYPAGAYVTYEHEYILIFRKGDKRVFSEYEKDIRRQSAYFWEERNVWFSDLWNIKGIKQTIKFADRNRNASYPIDIPYRLINMYSIYGDTVLDPFGGLGTTSLAALMSGRNSILVDISFDFVELAQKRIGENGLIDQINGHLQQRLQTHVEFINELTDEKKANCYFNSNHHILVKTKQETDIVLYKIDNIHVLNSLIICDYKRIEKKNTP